MAKLVGHPQDELSKANGTAEPRASGGMLTAMPQRVGHRIGAGEDEAHDAAARVAILHASGVTPHVDRSNAPTETCKSRRRPSAGGPQGIRATVCRSQAAP